MKPTRIILAVTVAAAALLAQSLFPSSAAAPLKAMCDRTPVASGPDIHVVTSTASLHQQPACTAD